MPLSLLFVTGYLIGLPLCKAQANNLSCQVELLLLRGEEMVVDTSVWCAWQLCPSQLTFGNPNQCRRQSLDYCDIINKSNIDLVVYGHGLVKLLMQCSRPKT